MLVEYNPEDYEVISGSHTCDYHKRNPKDVAWPGCTYWGSYRHRKKVKKSFKKRAAA